MIPLVVALPVSPPDYHLAVKWLKWAVALRREGNESLEYPLIVVAAASLEADDLVKLALIFYGIPGWSVVQQSEKYERPELGYAAAANMMFRFALETVEKEFPDHPMLWAEADTVPTRPSWFYEIASEYIMAGKPFMGAFHPHGAIPHMSGNAVYTADWREKAPSFAKLPGDRPQQGWDSACAKETVPQMHIAETIQQEWITPPFSEYNTDKILKPKTALFHRTKDGTLIDVLAKRNKMQPIALEAPIAPPTSTMAEMAQNRIVTPTVRIMIVTHAKDMDFLRYCLASIKKYASGFAGVTLVVPEHERGLYDWVKGAIVRYFPQPEEKGMLSHLIQKCRADEWCPDTDFIVHMDADCMFFRDVTPAAFVKDWRALSVREAYANITNPHRHGWAERVEQATGIRPEYDYMLRHPQVHPSAVYKATREYVEGWTKQAFNDYVLSGQNVFPQSFCEFNTLSTIGKHLFVCCYNYVDYNKALDAQMIGQDPGSFQYVYKRNVDFVVEWWSHGGIGRYRSDCDAVLGGRIPAYWVK